MSSTSTSRRFRIASIESKKRYKITKRVELQKVNKFGIEFTEPVKTFDCVATCKICGREYDPFADAATNPYQVERVFGPVCSEDCWAESLSGIRGTPQPWVKLRAATSDYNVARAAFREQERPTRASILAERQRRLDKVRELWDAGFSPMEIGTQLGHKHTAIYSDLRALGIDVKGKQAEQERTARDALIARIKELLDQGMTRKDIAPVVGLSPAMTSYFARKYLNAGDDRKRKTANEKNPSK